MAIITKTKDRPPQATLVSDNKPLVLDGYICMGCGRPDLHKMCPAWGTPMYGCGGDGKVFTKEDEEKYAEVRKVALENAKNHLWLMDY